jgi:hypothetical protein
VLRILMYHGVGNVVSVAFTITHLETGCPLRQNHRQHDGLGKSREVKPHRYTFEHRPPCYGRNIRVMASCLGLPNPATLIDDVIPACYMGRKETVLSRPTSIGPASPLLDTQDAG